MELKYLESSNIKLDVGKVNRIEIIGKGGRETVRYFENAEWSLQDDGKTLKLFICENR